MEIYQDKRILTLYLTKDETTFIKENYESVKNQQGVNQDIFVISAKPLAIEKNIIIPMPQTLPLPIRIGLSLNYALKTLNLHKYSHIFKVDGDIKLPQDYLSNLLEKNVPIAGRGAALLISNHFFMKHLSGKYPINYCDDGYITALSISLGYWPPEYDGKGFLKIPPIGHFFEREYYYGFEYYKWGFPLKLLMLFSLISLLENREKNFKCFLFNIAGYISAFIKGEERYKWWKNYAYVRTYHFITKLLSFLI